MCEEAGMPACASKAVGNEPYAYNASDVLEARREL
jgi:hypothetical protein